MTSAATLVEVDPVDAAVWDRLVAAHPLATVFHSAGWMRALRDTYGFGFRATIGLDARGLPTAGVAYSHVEDPLGSRVVSLPFSDFCDPLVDDLPTWQAVTAGLVTAGDRVQFRCLHNEVPLADTRFALVDRAMWHRTDLDATDEQAWARLDGAARQAVRRAGKAGVSVVAATDEHDVRRFYDLHLRVRKHKYRLLAQPFGLFLALWREFVARDLGTLLLAHHRGEVVGGVFFLGWGDTLYYKFNASDPAHLAARPNDLVVWEAMRWARDHGYRFLDFGLSAWEQEGLQRFKRKYATEERPISLLRHTNAPPAASQPQVQRLLADVTALAVDDATPDHVTEAAGDALYRYFA